ncbi:unannotated protein [freshwater metagenome]|uniref:Unannotated protein n=1 Tax=freshwater metagenome TaxID=449393 RepID=A0A6J6HV62_9ZZZZ
MKVTGENLRKEELFLPIGAVVHDRRANGIERKHWHWCASTHRLVEEYELIDRASSLTAVFLGPTNSGPPIGTHLLPDVLGGLADSVTVREGLNRLFVKEIVVIGAKLCAQGFLLW